MCVAEFVDVLRKVAKEENVLVTDFTCDFDLGMSANPYMSESVLLDTHISTIARSDDEATVEAELHVARSRCLGSGGRDMLADVTCRADNLSFTDIIVLQEDDLQQVADIRILVDHLTNLVDEVDHGLRHPVSRCGLASKDGDAWSELLLLLGRHLLDLKVAVDYTKDIQLLTLVLVNALDLHIEKCSGVDGDAVVLLDVLCKSHLVRVLDLAELLPEVLVIDERLELMQESQVFQEFMTAKF